MAKEQVVRCDACSATKLVGEDSEHHWLYLQTLISSAEEYARVAESVQAGVPLENVIDGGDFCSLKCVANWASARFEMRQLGEATDEEGLTHEG